MRRIPDSTARLVVPLGDRVSFVLMDSVRVFMRLYEVSRPAASFVRQALGSAVDVPPRLRNRRAILPARVGLRAVGAKLRVTLRLPPGRFVSTSLRALLKRPPAAVKTTLRPGPGGAILTFDIALPGRR